MDRLPVRIHMRTVAIRFGAGQQEIAYRRNDKQLRPGRLPLFLIHGAGGSHVHWPPQLRHLPGQSVIAPDLPGHGASPPPDRRSISDYATSIIALADALEISRFLVAGHSMGAFIGQELALHHAARLGGLILLGGATRLQISAQLMALHHTDFLAATALMNDYSYGPRAPAILKEMALQRLREIPVAQFLADLAACEGFDSRTLLGEITTPTLVIAADADRLTPPAESLALHAGISGSRLVCVEGVAHMLMLEQPTRIAALIADFLDELGPG